VNERVLIVDDDEGICNAVTMALDQVDLKTEFRTDVTEGMSFYKEFKPNLVLLDFRMPNGGGPRFLDFLEKEKQTTPVILTSAMPNLDTISNSIHIRHLLRKPFSIVQLYDVIGKTLNLKLE